MGLTTDPDDPALKATRLDGQQEKYLVLSEEERAKGFVRPVRRSYRHVGTRPEHSLRDLTPEEHERYDRYGYVKFEEYPKEGSPKGGVGRYWTRAQLESGCGGVTIMGLALAETYARNPKFYGATFCVECGVHLPVGEQGEFTWEGTNEKVGT